MGNISLLDYSTAFLCFRPVLSTETYFWQEELKLLLRQKYQNTQVTDIGPKDSNFPQNAWRLLDGTAHDHIFGVIPGNSDHITYLGTLMQ